MAEKEGDEAGDPAAESTSYQLELPTGRVKKIMKIDKEINKVNSEALFLISSATELFLQFLAEKSAQVALEKKKKTIKLDHLRVVVKRHQPTRDFLLESLPLPAQSADEERPPKDPAKSRPAKPVPIGTRRIDAFFQKCT